MKMSTSIFVLLLLCCTLHLSTSTHRRVLHQPFIPLTSTPPSPSPSPSSSPPPPPPQPKLPFSSSPPSTGGANNAPFFPSGSPPVPPSNENTPIPTTLPANISSIALPHSTSPASPKPFSTKLIAIAATLSSITLLSLLALFVLYYTRRHRPAPAKPSRSSSLRLYPPTSATQVPPPRRGGPSGEFLYVGTVGGNPLGGDVDGNKPTDSGTAVSSSALVYQKLGSPELCPLPPLPRQHFQRDNPNAEAASSPSPSPSSNRGGEKCEEEEEFYSPTGSSGSKERSFRGMETEGFGGRSFKRSYSSSNSSSPTHSTSNNSTSPPLNSSPMSSNSESPDSVIKFPAPRISDVSHQSSNGQSTARIGSVFSRKESPPKAPPAPPPPPPPPPPRPTGYWETPTAPASELISGPPVLITPTRPTVFRNAAPLVSSAFKSQNSATVERSDDTPRPKLKPLHWDKVRASSDRAMVWDQLKSSSFKLNEEMIETLFMVNGSNLAQKDTLRPAILQAQNQENQVLDPKKSQNIAILLRALHVTIDEVCEALLEGNADTLGTELLESLLKMTPTKEEERKLKEFKDESPVKLGPAERFLKAVIDIPFAFERVDAMLYIANFESEVDYLKRSFKSLEAACGELRNSRMFLKLLEAVLKTGNRMNVGTNRGDAHAFKLDTLLKLVDVKGADGKTTLLHFVVQEITRAEGSRLSAANQNQADDRTPLSAPDDDVKFRKLGLQVVSGLSGELANVKKAAAMDCDVLDNDVAKLAGGMTKMRGVVKLIEELALEESSQKFCQSMNGFLQRAEEEIISIQAQEAVALSLVKELTVYFHGNSAKEEAHPFRIFMVVRDFLSTLDRVCKEVEKINEGTIVSSVQQFPQPVNPVMPPVFLGFNGRHRYKSSDDESLSSTSSS